jgi:hypothetical protein
MIALSTFRAWARSVWFMLRDAIRRRVTPVMLSLRLAGIAGWVMARMMPDRQHS